MASLTAGVIQLLLDMLDPLRRLAGTRPHPGNLGIGRLGDSRFRDVRLREGPRQASVRYSPRFRARKGIDRRGDPFELGCELPRFIRRKYSVRVV